MDVYRIKEWAKHYENNRTKELKEMHWVPIPNSHDGEGYCQMVEGIRGAAVLGAWVACIQVASRCEPRGTLLRKSRTPHTAASLASRTRLPAADFEEMLRRAISPSVDWMEVVDIERVILIPQEGAGISREPAVVSSFLPSIPSLPEEGMQGEKIPTLEEVMAEGRSRKFAADQSERFFNYYESTGWLVGGKIPVKSWRALLKGWMAKQMNGDFEKKNHKPPDVPKRVGGAFSELYKDEK